MAHLLHDVYDWYKDLMDNRSGEANGNLSSRKVFFNLFVFLFADPRVKDWPMMQSPLPTLALCISYAYFCRSLAPRLMENRKPFDLRRTLIFYNLFQTVFSAWIFYEVSKYLAQRQSQLCPINISRFVSRAVSPKWLVAGLQLQVSTCGLFAEGPSHGRDVLVVLYL